MTPSRAAVLALLCAADLLVMLDGMVVTVALPAIERDLGTAHADLQWVVTAYTLSLGAFLLVGGRAGDLYGRRRALVGGPRHLRARVAGGGPRPRDRPAARRARRAGTRRRVRRARGPGAADRARFRQQRERERALGTLSATLAGGMVAGLVLGGVLTASLGWPWCFFLVVPFGLAAAVLAPAVLEESRDGAGAAARRAGRGAVRSRLRHARLRARAHRARRRRPPRPSSSPPGCSSPASWPSSGAPPRRWCGRRSCVTGRWPAPTSRSSRTPAASPA